MRFFNTQEDERLHSSEPDRCMTKCERAKSCVIALRWINKSAGLRGEDVHREKVEASHAKRDEEPFEGVVHRKKRTSFGCVQA